MTPRYIYRNLEHLSGLARQFLLVRIRTYWEGEISMLRLLIGTDLWYYRRIHLPETLRKAGSDARENRFNFRQRRAGVLDMSCESRIPRKQSGFRYDERPTARHSLFSPSPPLSLLWLSVTSASCPCACGLSGALQRS